MRSYFPKASTNPELINTAGGSKPLVGTAGFAVLLQELEGYRCKNSWGLQKIVPVEW